MKRFSSTLLLVMVLMAAVTSSRVEAQQKAANETSALMQYQMMKKDVGVPVVLALIVPIAGCSSAGDAKPCYVPAAVRGGGLLLMVLGIAEAADYQDGSGKMMLGSLAYTAGTIWEAVTAYQTVEKHNAELRKNLGIASAEPFVAPVRLDGAGGQKTGLAVGVRLAVNL
ncbi:MAG: hypothetical protein ACT4O1_00510 [Gemmatimonadota bacterium]